MRIFYALIFLFIALTASAQDSLLTEEYAEIALVPKTNGKSGILVDYGRNGGKWETLSDGSNPVIVATAAGAINYFQSLGWNFVATYAVNESGNLQRYLFKREIKTSPK